MAELRVELRRDAGRFGPTHGPWLRRKQVAHVRGPEDPSAVAEVRNHRGDTLGWGLYSPDSSIAVRMLTFETRPPADWLERRLAAALGGRAALGLPSANTTGYREVNSEGDGLPGLVVDRYEDDRVVQLTTAPMVAREAAIEAWLRANRPGPLHLLVPEGAVAREGIEARTRLDGNPPALSFREHGLDFQVPPPPGQKTGAYLDQRDNRRVVAGLAAGHGGPLLDLGCHAGGFALHAAAAGVEAVGLDRSRLMLERAAANAERNGLTDRVRWVEADLFARLEAPELTGPFGTVVVDPPRMATGRRDRDRALQALTRLTGQAMDRLAPDGHLVLCSCSHHLDRSTLDAAVLGARRGSWTRVLALGPGPDHPVWPGHTEGEYLRVNVYQRR